MDQGVEMIEVRSTAVSNTKDDVISRFKASMARNGVGHQKTYPFTHEVDFFFFEIEFPEQIERVNKSGQAGDDDRGTDFESSEYVNL